LAASKGKQSFKMEEICRLKRLCPVEFQVAEPQYLHGRLPPEANRERVRI
jgi:hypothetical protein